MSSKVSRWSKYTNETHTTTALPADEPESPEADYPKNETVHYLTPASLSARSEYEGDPFGFFRHTSKAYPTTPSPSKQSSSDGCDHNELQRTLVIVKPDAIAYRDTIRRVITHGGLHIINERTVHLTPEQTAEIFFQHYGYPYFPNIVVKMSQNPVLVLSVYGKNAVEKLKLMVGPTKGLREQWFYPRSMKIRFGIQRELPDSVHVSDSVKEAAPETRYIFPEEIIEPIKAEREQFDDYFAVYIKPILLNACAELVRAKPVDPIIYLAEWLLLNNHFKPVLPYAAAVAPT